MTSTGYPPGAVVPLPFGPDLDQDDAARIPRWLYELTFGGFNAAYDLLSTGDLRRAPNVDLTPAEQGQLCAYLEDKWCGQ